MENGISNQISLGKESTYGTPVVPSLSLPVGASDGIQVKQEVIGIESIKGTSPKNKGMFLGKQSFEGAYDMGAYPQSFGFLLLSALGGLSTSTIEAGTVYKHTFTESPTKPGLTIEQVIGQISKRYAGFVVNKIKISAKVGDLVMVNISGFAKSQADATAITKTYETVRPFNWADVASLSVGSTDISDKVESFEIEYDNGVEMFYSLGAITPADRFPKQSTVKGKIECYVDDTTSAYLADMIAGTQKALVLTLTGDAIGSVSHNGLVITLSKCSFTKFETKLSFGYNALSLEFDTSEDSTNGLIKIELTNGTASY